MEFVPDFNPMLICAAGLQPYSAFGFSTVLNSCTASSGRITDSSGPPAMNPILMGPALLYALVSVMPTKTYTLYSARIPLVY